MKRFIWFLTFIYILGPVPNTALGPYLDTIQLVCVLLMVAFALKRKKYVSNPAITRLLKMCLSLFSYVVFLGLPLTLLLHANDFTPDVVNALIRPLRIILTFFGGLALVTIYKDYYPNSYYYQICGNIVQILILNGVIMFFQLYLPAVNNFLTTILYNNISEIHFQVENRVGGLYLSGGAIPSMYQGIALIIIPFLYMKKELNLLQVVVYSLLIVASIIITGRSGLVLLMFSILMYMWNASFSRKFFYFVLLSVFIFMLPQFLLILQNRVETSENEMLLFNFNRFLRLIPFVGDGSTDSTVEVLLGKLSIPDDFWSLMFGNLNFSNYTFTQVSDMGYNVSLYKYGLIGWLLYYAPVLYMTYFVFQIKGGIRYEGMFLRFLMIIYLVLELKEEVIYARNGFSIVLLIFLSATLLYSNAKASPRLTYRIN